jgi:hypothetical protein
VAAGDLSVEAGHLSDLRHGEKKAEWLTSLNVCEPSRFAEAS